MTSTKRVSKKIKLVGDIRSTGPHVVLHGDIAKLAYIKSMTNDKSANENWLTAEKELQGI